MASSLEMVFRKARGAEKRGDEAEARRLFEDVLKAYPHNVTARQGLARLRRDVDPAAQRARIDLLVAAHHRGDHAETIRLGEALLHDDPMLEHVRTLTGTARIATAAYEEAEDDFRAEIRMQPGKAAHHNHLGVALMGQARLEEAEASLDEALRLEPGHVDALFNRVLVLEGLECFAEAIVACDAVLAIAPDHIRALHRIGVLHSRMGDHPQAVQSFLAVLDKDAAHGGALLNLGRSLMTLSRYDKAVEAFRLAVRAEPDNVDTHNNLGLALTAAGQPREAIVAFAHAAGIEPQNYGIWGRLISLQGQICDWTNRSLMAMLPYDTEFGSIPFDALPFEDDAHHQLRRSINYATNRFADIDMPYSEPERAPGGKIRIGYLSADFYAHATIYLMAGLFREHDRSRFEIICFDFSPVGASTPIIAPHVDAMVDIRALSSREAVDLIRSYRLDIAVDLKGHTKDGRPQLLAARVAPVQIAYLGYPGSSGMAEIDYILADPVVIPAGLEDAYSEKVIRLPGSYQPNDEKRPITDCGDARVGLGLPDDGIVFCCFNQNYKIGPREFDIWMRLLREVYGSVLWLLDCGEAAETNLRREAEARGVDPARLVFAPGRPHTQHLGRLRHADLFLDTFCYNAHTTASDALWAGVPVVTMPGHQFAARVGASLLTAIGMPDLIAGDEQTYFEKALHLARTPAALAEARARVAANRRTHPLFDTRRYARDIEQAYALAHERHMAGLVPDHFDVR